MTCSPPFRRCAGGETRIPACLAHLWNLVGTVAQGLRQLPAKEPQYALSVAWNACDVASRWQREALNNTDAGRAANDRLDTAMRLFDYASGSAASGICPNSFAQVRARRSKRIPWPKWPPSTMP